MRYFAVLLVGVSLVSGCLSSRREEKDCAAGTRGCPCLAGDVACLDASLVCNANNLCEDQACLAGTQGCACREDGEPCGAGLACVDELCQIPAGVAGGACLPGDTCQAGYACQSGVCVACQEGARRCACLDGGACDAGLVCVTGRCVVEPSEVLARPANPSCYTPCVADLAAAGVVLRCPESGLWPGCVGERVCRDGSCVLAEETPRACLADAECPDFQACFDGLCMSNCERTSDCPHGLECHRKVCRVPCHTGADDCPAGQSCISADGQNGACGPLISGENVSCTEVVGGFGVAPARLDFSNLTTRRTLTITNTGAGTIAVTVRAKSERQSATRWITDSPLAWLRFGLAGACEEGAGKATYQLAIPAKTRATVEVCDAATPNRPSFEGAIEIASAGLGAKTIDIAYAARPDGQWAGKSYYFANFDDTGLAAWVAAGRGDGAALAGVKNAFVRRFAELKLGRITLDELRAVMQATETEAWRWPSVVAKCQAKNPGGACYLYDNIDGFSTYTTSQEVLPVPSGIVELPFAMNIREVSPSPDSSCAPVVFEGKIDSAKTLHYAGDPAVRLQLRGLSPACGADLFGANIVDVVELDADVHVGGRYLSRQSDTFCRDAAAASGFVPYRTPWLVPGFTSHTDLDPIDQARYLYECRSGRLPFGELQRDQNLALAAANPIPDGRARARSLQLIDGALIDAQTMVLLFRETFAGFLEGEATFSAYGYMVLERKTSDLTAADFLGSAPSYTEANASKLEVACDRALTDQILGESLTANLPGNAEVLADALLRGPEGGQAVVLDQAAEERVHYLCVTPTEQSFFSGGEGVARECPANSAVIYFTLRGVDDANVADHTCNLTGICSQELWAWVDEAYGQIRIDPAWRCTDPAITYCDDDRYDLRAGKTFFAATSAPALLPLQTQVEQAFAYKARFLSRAGLNTGFTPSLCTYSASEIPYCYDPAIIEAITTRVDCALDLYGNADAYGLAEDTRERLRAYLATNFAFAAHQDATFGAITKREGFDYLFAELLIMLGDEAFAAAFSSRFDLAGAAVYGFAGADFEPEGINLSGVAGHEMFRLYQSAQYYQRVLDRFFRLSPKLEAPSAKSFVSADTVTTYFSHLIRASTQKAKVWSEVAKTYHSLDRPKLAKQVVARAYTATYMESTILAGIMRRVLEEASPEDKAAIVASIDNAARSYRQALLNMQTVYAKVSAALNFMGFAADYIPFPALDAKDGNAFDKLWASASTKLQLAIARENEALAQRRQYETDAQSFRSELLRIRTEYENELASICGTFVGDDGQVYPAVSAYAEKSAKAAAIGDPCGLLGNGQLYEVSLGIGSARLEVAAVRQQLDNVEAEIASEERRVREQCELVASEVQFLVEQDGQANSLQAEIDAARSDVDGLRATQAKAAAKMQTWSFCSPSLSIEVNITDLGIPSGSTSINPGACYQARKTEGAMSSTSEGIVASEESIRVGEQRLRKLQQATMRWQLGKRCDEVELESQARVRSMVLRLAELGIAARKTGYNVLLAQAKHRELENQAQRLLAQQQDALQMAVDIAAARNDPNVRIYKNDAILAADRTFGDALAETYRLTKVYEYYTSQSYEKLGDLYLVRMAQHGEPSLEAYLADLGKAFDRFEEQYGNPDVRVAVLSLRDDILEIPRLSARGQALSHTERVRLLRERLVSTSLLDERGYRVIPFGTRLDLASPLTRAHKIQHLEAEIDGTSVGDDLGRVYVTQRGTGVVQGVSGATSFYAFPERTAVLDVSFNGHQVFAPEVYKSERLRDRPLINTAWQLILNQRDEAVNQDIDINAITDIRLYVFYTDFTAL